MKQNALLLVILLSCLIGTAQTVNIGDILCTDGSIVSSEMFPSSGKTAQGVVFYVDNTDSHGWAVSLENQSSSIKWCGDNNYGYDIPDLPNRENARVAMHDLDGRSNTQIIRSHGNSSQFPAAWAVDYDNGWYLPSAGQLRYLYSYAPEINASLQVVGGESLPYYGNNYWWSSTEFSAFHAYDMNAGGSIGDYVKDNHNNYPPNGIAVRQIRDFTIQNPMHPTYHIGDLITNDDGSQGILFYLTPDQTCGWMVALDDASTSISWGSEDVPELDNQACTSPYGLLLDETDGYSNTGIIKTHQSGLSTAANVVDYEHGWYLPTAGQLSKLFGALGFIEDALQSHGSTLANAEYWSSTEADGGNAFTLSCNPSANVRAGHFVRRDKTSSHRVRAVRDLCFTIPPLPEPTFPDNVIETECNQPLNGNAWNVELLYSTPEVVASYAPVVVGDIDGNGVVDILISHFNGNNYRTNTLDVYSGLDVSLQYRFNIQDSIYNTTGNYAICRYPLPDGSQQGAIFVHSYDRKIRSYAINGTLLNVSDRATTCEGMVSFADFNGDGYPEVYAGSDVFDAATLKWLCSGPANGNKGESYRGSAPGVVNSHRCYYAMSLACNVLGDARQELICGNTIYDVNIVSRTNPALNSITVNKTVTPPSGYSSDGHVSLADFDLDGECEVLVTRNDTDDHTMGTVYFYAYKSSNGQILFQKTVQCLCTGYPLIGNINDDPYPEIVFLEKQQSYYPMYIYCWHYEPQGGLQTVWQYQHSDSSGQTGITLFDFNQDDIMELVYRDSDDLRIINGSGKSHVTGNDTIQPYNIYTRMMAAGTGCEYPVIADVNGDGSAEIVVSGLLDQYANLPGIGGLHMFGNPGHWAAARPVWNQYMYHVTNVNEDLTIPTSCFDKATVFTAPGGTVRRPYNNFLQQAGYINQYGEPYNPGGVIEVDVEGLGCSFFTFHGTTYDQDGTYELSVEGGDCDTIFHINVSLGEIGYYEWSYEACDSFTWNGETYTEPGDYVQTFVTPQGCDSIVTLHLSMQTPTAIPDINGPTEVYVSTDLIYGRYTYFINPIENATHYEWLLEGPDWPMDTDGLTCSLWITLPGNATLTVRAWNDCGYTEQEIIIHAGFHDVDDFQTIPVALYPNPANDKVFVEADGVVRIKLYDLKGRCVLELQGNHSQKAIIDLQSLSSRLYIVEVVTDQGIARAKLNVQPK